ncbi:MAG: hypothetical protein JW821_15880 [Deltaproteobacteria bacterium]|nr:hypothetical protein [Deltaproteobacteria bacterium]
MTDPVNKRMAAFVSPHGFGHAARATAVMEALQEKDPSWGFDIFTTVPEWFFAASLSGAFTYHPLLTDIGLKQRTPLEADLSGTVRLLDGLFPPDPTRIRALARSLSEAGCRGILCDISPLGIAVAREAGIPSVLIENFTWDWIYGGYAGKPEGLGRHAAFLKGLFEKADFHIQTAPACRRNAPDLIIRPVCRKPRDSRWKTRERLGIPREAPLVLITMGGIPDRFPFLRKLEDHPDVRFIIAGASENMETRGRLLLLPSRSEYFHPDLIRASDAVIGKLGYSTMAEVYEAGTPFGYIASRGFPESRVLVSFVRRRMRAVAVGDPDFYRGAWLDLLPSILALPRIRRRGIRGADQAAEFISRVLS